MIILICNWIKQRDSINQFINLSKQMKDQGKAINFNSQNYSICLNPQCSASNRYFQAGKIEASSHFKCQKWCKTLQYFMENDFKTKNNTKDNYFDFLASPIQGIFELKSIEFLDWKSHLAIFYQSVKKQIDQALLTSYNKSIQKINGILQKNSLLWQNIKLFCYQISQQKLYHKNIYEQRLKQQLADIYKMGQVTIINQESIRRFMKKIINNIRKFEDQIWKCESLYDIEEKIESINNSIKKIDTSTGITNVNNFLQQLKSCLQLKEIKFYEKDKLICLQCQICHFEVKGQGNNTKQKRNSCIFQLTDHIQNIHEDILQQKCKNKRKPLRLSFQDFIKEIQSTNKKKFLIIDRENMASYNNKYIEDTYTLEIVSKKNCHIVTGKYLVADTQEKDAADILIILALYEISKIKHAEIVLLSNDHFATTLKPIFYSMGRSITTISKYIKQKSQKSKKNNGIEQQILIE